MEGLERGAALAIDNGSGHRLWPAGCKHSAPTYVEGLGSDLTHAAEDHVIHSGRVEPRSTAQLLQHMSRKIHRMDVLEGAIPLAHWRSDRSDDVRLSHPNLPSNQAVRHTFCTLTLSITITDRMCSSYRTSRRSLTR